MDFPEAVKNGDEMFTQQNTIEYKSRDGKNIIKIKVLAYLGKACVEASINGKKQLGSSISFNGKGLPNGYVASIGKLVLDQEKADLVKVMITTLQTEIDARPEVIAAKADRQAHQAKITRVATIQAEVDAQSHLVEVMSRG